MRLRVIGSGAALPTVERGASALLIEKGKARILVDCAEGTARELMRHKLSVVEDVIITHEHVDHIGGIHGLVRAMDMAGSGKLSIYAPPGAREKIQNLISLAQPRQVLVALNSVDVGIDFVVQGMTVRAYATSHGVESRGYRITEAVAARRLDIQKCQALGLVIGPILGQLRREGEIELNGAIIRLEDVLLGAEVPTSIVITGDTLPTQATIDAARGADLLVHESTYLAPDEDLARSRYHSTARDVGRLAKAAGVGAVLLTHLSARYADLGAFSVEAAEEAAGTVRIEQAEDGMVLEVEKRRMTIGNTVPERACRR